MTIPSILQIWMKKSIFQSIRGKKEDIPSKFETLEEIVEIDIMLLPFFNVC